MGIIRSLKRTRLAGLVRERIYHKTIRYANRMKDKKRLKRYNRIDRLSGAEPLEGRLVMDKVDVVVTTKCNLLCSGCSHLMPYYKDPEHLDKDRVIASMQKLAGAVDWFDHFNILGGEPFLYPDLKDVLEAIPAEKCRLVQVLTNATIIPDDPALFDVMRRKKVHVAITPYPSNQRTREQLMAALKAEGVDWGCYAPAWTDYGQPRNYHRSRRDLWWQFNRCGEICKNLFDGKLYYCHRSAHVTDLGFCRLRRGDAVDLLQNSAEKNRRQVRRMMWRHRPVAACQYCLMGTDQNVEIPRGK